MPKITLIAIIALVLLMAGVTVGSGQVRLWKQPEIRNSADLIKSNGGIGLLRETTLNLKPPFYKGTVPLQYQESIFYIRLAMMGGGTAVGVHDFGEWQNIFIYKDELALISGMPDGAISLDKSLHLVAESRVLRMLENNKQLAGFEILEVHYGQGGEKIFTANFQTDFPMGFKVKETGPIGKKNQDYYFIWASGFNH